ncbi:MAG: hypothetical protein A2X05_08620 [Bacteroidetes bacterium GWE2_41_25]|nr:MAG: hypothetical protein A2X03_17290 [Bacteroidetes bacterium GWA2_40_15]OFX97164.1 MAG: hypothetical protein A2X06_06230 [Bacteroidetes bacterium GWC2_40_22]OFY05058.1 MAG: hypothetical protein A2X05_08620 [Bacteroidetes bacterium GWE2_41_25]OFY57825.1 MAG: hypothetical protein A2X04_01330 [Bacteroidetes bacterium GWF2_41_9]HBQ83332.1 hypothetical protein [Bacteroidales bacterium]
MNRSIVSICILLILTSLPLNAQFETRQAGFRMGYTSGIFYQVSQEAGNAEVAFNGLLSFNDRGVQFTGLKVIYETSIGDISPNLVFAWGYGGHVGFIYSDHVKFMGEDYYFHGDRFCPLIGMDGWVAAEYRITDIPLNISLNVKPYVELAFPSFLRVTPWDFAVSISYVF